MSTLADDTIELRVPSKPEYVSIVRGVVTDLAHRMALPASAVEDVQVAVSEACANVVCHAYPDEYPEPPEMLIRCRTRDECLVMEVSDRGRGFSESGVPRHHRERNGGFGLLLIRNLMDDVSLDTSPHEGTVIRMVKLAEIAEARRSSVTIR